MRKSGKPDFTLINILVMPIIVALSFNIISCTYSYYFSVELIESTSSRNFTTNYALGDIEFPLKSIKDGHDGFRDSEVYPGLYDHRDYKIHPDSEYYCLVVSYSAHAVAQVDSVYIQSAPDYGLKLFNGWDIIVQNNMYNRIIVQPVVVHKDYHNPIYFQLYLKFYALDNKTLIEEVRLRLKCIPQRDINLGR